MIRESSLKPSPPDDDFCMAESSSGNPRNVMRIRPKHYAYVASFVTEETAELRCNRARSQEGQGSLSIMFQIRNIKVDLFRGRGNMRATLLATDSRPD